MIKTVIDKDTCLSYWPLTHNENDIVGSNHFTVYLCSDGSIGTPIQRDGGPFGSAITPCGSTNLTYLNAPFEYGWRSSDWTVEGFAKLDSSPFLAGLFSNRGLNTEGWWTLGYYSGTLYWENISQLDMIPINPSDGKWHKYTVTFSYVENIVRIYLDYSLIHEVGMNYESVGNIEHIFQLGNWYNQYSRAAGYYQPWTGQISHVAVHNICKTAKQIQTEFFRKRNTIC